MTIQKKLDEKEETPNVSYFKPQKKFGWQYIRGNSGWAGAKNKTGHNTIFLKGLNGMKCFSYVGCQWGYLCDNRFENEIK